jgi:hypothetical protein
MPAGAFVALPMTSAANSSQAALYKAAYEAALQTSRERAFRAYVDRVLFSVMN